MTRLPRLKAKDVLRALRRAGFSVERSRGSHFFLKHADAAGLWSRCIEVKR